MQPTPTQIKEIAEQLDCGFCCYYNIRTGESVFIPDFDQTMSDMEEFFGEDLAKIKKDEKNFITITKPSSVESFEIMEDFVKNVAPTKLREKLLDALDKKRPFAHFKAIIDDAGEHRQKWFDFKLMKMQEHVVMQLNSLE